MFRIVNELTNSKVETKLNNITKNFPDFIISYFEFLKQSKSLGTTLAYAYDISIFFAFLIENYNEEYRELSIREITLSQFDLINENAILIYLEWLDNYTNQKMQRSNKNAAKKRKLESLKSLYKYLYKNKLVSSYPIINIDNPIIYPSEKKLIEANSIKDLKISLINGANQTEYQKKGYHSKTVERDYAIIVLILNAGLSSTECANLNLGDFRIKDEFIRVIKTNSDYKYIPFSDYIKAVILQFLEIRKKQKPLMNHEQAFFLSMQNKRIDVRTIQKLVKKYTTEYKSLNSMDLRKTFSNVLYQDTKDITLVTSILGNNDIYHTMKNAIDILYKG